MYIHLTFKGHGPNPIMISIIDGIQKCVMGQLPVHAVLLGLTNCPSI